MSQKDIIQGMREIVSAVLPAHPGELRLREFNTAAASVSPSAK